MVSNLNIKETFGRRLAQARRMRGLSLRALAAATEGRVSYNALHRYEQGVMMPNDDVLLIVADVLNKPLDFFFRPYSIQLREIEFRKKTTLGEKSVTAIKEQALDFFERYLEIEQILGLPNDFKDPLGQSRLDEPEDAETAVEKIRNKWKLGIDALPNVLETLEINGFKVFEIDAPESFDGFSGWLDGRPIIVLAKWLNSDLPRKRFTALHEAGHVLLKKHTVLRGRGLERLCNRFAGAMLIPGKMFESDWGGFRHRISIEELFDLKRRYGISLAAIMYRAHDLRLVAEPVYKRFFITYKKEGWHRGEPGDYAGTEISTRFEQLVLRAVAEDTISISKGAVLLNESLAEFRSRFREII
jgi:Zn-dependent peptidase ImmA (M78 family)